MAEVYAAANNIKKANAIKELILHESKKRMFAILREKLTKKSKGQLNKVWNVYNEHGEYMKDNENKISIQSAEEVHKQLLIGNRKHLG